MLDALTSAYSRKDHDNQQRLLPLETNIGKLFAVFAWGLDSVQEQAELIKLWDSIDYACGSVLDRYGANFGVKRFGAGDVFYRLAIKVKLLSQLSGGDIDTVLNATAALFEIPVERIEMGEIFPSKVRLNVQEADLSSDTFASVVDIIALIKRILAAGVGMDLNIILKLDPFQEPIGDFYLHRLRIGVSANEPQDDLNFSSITVRASAQHVETTSGELTMDNWRTFDGSISFDGFCQFDAYYVKEEF